MATIPRLAINDTITTLPSNTNTPISPSNSTPNPITSPIDPVARRLALLQKLRAPPFRYAWNFWHDKASAPASSTSTYETRLTLLAEDITTVKPFWEVLNSFPFGALKVKDSVHLFKRGVKPVWEDRRNVEGGAWTFRVPKAKAEGFFREVLLMGVGEQFCDGLDAGDEVLGFTLSPRFATTLISIWHRRASCTASREGILRIVRATLSPDLQSCVADEGSYYYKRHDEHAGFKDVVGGVEKEGKEEREKGGDSGVEKDGKGGS